MRIEIFAYLNTSDWVEYLGLAEALNLQILKTVADSGSSLSPSTSALRIESEPSQPA